MDMFSFLSTHLRVDWMGRAVAAGVSPPSLAPSLPSPALSSFPPVPSGCDLICTFSWVCWPSVLFLWRNVHSAPPPWPRVLRKKRQRSAVGGQGGAVRVARGRFPGARGVAQAPSVCWFHFWVWATRGWCTLSSSRAQAARPGPARPRLTLQARACAPVTVSCALCPLAPGWSLLHWVGLPALLGRDLVPVPS